MCPSVYVARSALLGSCVSMALCVFGPMCPGPMCPGFYVAIHLQNLKDLHVAA